MRTYYECSHLEDAENLQCLTPRTPYTQGPDPDDTPEPCGSCPMCEAIAYIKETQGQLNFLRKQFLPKGNCYLLPDGSCIGVECEHHDEPHP